MVYRFSVGKRGWVSLSSLNSLFKVLVMLVLVYAGVKVMLLRRGTRGHGSMSKCLNKLFYNKKDPRFWPEMKCQSVHNSILMSECEEPTPVH